AVVARGPDGPEKLLDQRRILDARSAFHTGRNVYSGRVGQSQGIADVGGVESTGKHVFDAGVKAGKDAPVEGDAVAARKLRSFRRLGVEHETIGNAGERLYALEVGCLAYGKH